jgi:hypothetical protein
MTSKTTNTFSPEVRAGAVRMPLDHRQPACLSRRPEPPRPGLCRGRPEPEVGR